MTVMEENISATEDDQNGKGFHVDIPGEYGWRPEEIAGDYLGNSHTANYQEQQTCDQSYFGIGYIDVMEETF